jgi:hypothetical protein
MLVGTQGQSEQPGAAGLVRVRQIDDDESNRLMQIVRRGIGSAVTWTGRRAQMALVPGI